MKTNYKRITFDLDKAKRITKGEIKGRIVTRAGHQVRIICFDKNGWHSSYPIVALIQVEPTDERIYTFSKEGIYNTNDESSFDLMIEVPTYYNDYSNFKPCKWQSCLVRDYDNTLWIVRAYVGRNKVGDCLFSDNNGGAYTWKHYLPLSDITVKLIGTRKSYDELIQELDAKQTSIIQDIEFEDNKEFDFHEIKTFADACEKLGMKEHLLTGSEGGDREAQRQAQALYKLLIIQKAMNNGVWRDKDGFNYYPVFELLSKKRMDNLSEEEKQRRGIKQILSCAYTDHSGILCANYTGRSAYSYLDHGAILCFNSQEAALYAAKQFEDLFFQYYGIKLLN